MPLPQQDWDVIVPNPLMNEQLAYDQDAMSNRVEHNYPCFNPEQKLAFGKVINSAKNNKGKIFFLHSTGGCGKTHVSNTIAAAICADGHIALCMVLWFNLVRVEIRELRPEVVAKDGGVLVHYQSRTNA